jgi:hypothetical protein
MRRPGEPPPPEGVSSKNGRGRGGGEMREIGVIMYRDWLYKQLFSQSPDFYNCQLVRETMREF